MTEANGNSSIEKAPQIPDDGRGGMHVMTDVTGDGPEAAPRPGLPIALAAMAEAWVRLPTGAIGRLIQVAGSRLPAIIW